MDCFVYNSRWTDPDESGMVVIELQMLSGYVQEESNAALLARLASLGVKKVENKDKSLIFYIDQVGKILRYPLPNLALTVQILYNLKIYSHKIKNFKSVFYCYVHQLTNQNTTFTHFLED